MPVVNILGAPHAYELTDTPRASVCLVFIHGWLLSRHYWQPVIQQLATDYSCLAYDLRGFGESQPVRRHGERQTGEAALAATANGELIEAMAAAYSLSNYAEDLRELLQTLQQRRVWLLGHSLGGSIALWAAHLWPDRVQGVICLNAGGGVYIQPAFDQFRAAGQQMVKWRPRWLRQLPLLPRLFATLMVTQPLAERWGRQRLQDFISADPEAARAALLASTTAAAVHQLPKLVAGLQQPVYFIAGREDRIMPPRYVHHLASFHRLFRQGEANVFELADCGHMAMVEQPQQVAQRVRDILACYPDASQRQTSLPALGSTIGSSG